MGAVAKAVATLLTYPLQLAQSRLRANATSKSPEKSSTLGILLKISNRDGFGGMFKGMNAKLWQTVLTAAFQFLTYEQLAKFIFAILLGGKAKARSSGFGDHKKAK